MSQSQQIQNSKDVSLVVAMAILIGAFTLSGCRTSEPGDSPAEERAHPVAEGLPPERESDGKLDISVVPTREGADSKSTGSDASKDPIAEALLDQLVDEIPEEESKTELEVTPRASISPGTATSGDDGKTGIGSLESLVQKMNEAHSSSDAGKSGTGATPSPETTPPPAGGSPPTADTARAVAEAAAAAAVAKTSSDPKATETVAAPSEAVPRPKGLVTFKTMFHKTADETIRFLGSVRPEWIEKGNIAKVEGQKHSLVVFGDTEDPKDPVTAKIVDMLDRFDQLDLEIERRVIRPKYVDPNVAMDALLMAGVCNVWQLSDTTDALTWPVGSKTRTLTRTKETYVERGGKAEESPIATAPNIPFVYDMPTKDAFQLPAGYGGQTNNGSLVMSFDKSSSTEERGGMMAVGTKEDIEAIESFVESIDVPARRIMIEVQLIELDASKLTDLGIDSIQAGKGHTIGNLALPLPGESIVQPGVPSARDPSAVVPDVVGEGLELLFDDTSLDLQSRFIATVHALVRDGEAKVRARPKLLTLDDRVSALHLGRDVPTFASTSVTHDSTNGNIVSEVQSVSTVYSGITLHIRPRVTGGAHDRIALQIEVVDNQIAGRQQVFAQDLAGIPEVIKRQYIGEAVAHNHRPIILGGLIQEQEVESNNKIPLLGDIPFFGFFFRRTQTQSIRREVIIVVTPHILSEEGVDPSATPKESMHFDTFDSVLFNDRHILKGGDVLGLDPILNVPATGPDGKPFEEDDVLDLTLLNIVKKRELITKLKMFENYLSEDELSELNWMQKRWPEDTVASWNERDKELFFRVAAICIENVKDLNPELSFDDLTLARREIVLPTSPYHMSLSYSEVQRVQRLGLDHVFRGDRIELTAKHIALVRRASAHSLRGFGEFLSRQQRPDGSRGREATDHGVLREELLRLYRGLHPEAKSLENVSYTAFWRELDAVGISFNGIAAFLQANFEERYELEGKPDIGAFAADLEIFLKSTVSLKKRAQNLARLEDRWARVNVDDEDDSESN